MTMPLSSSEIQHIAEESANKAVRELLVAMGIDAHDPKALIEMQKNLAFLSAWRGSVDLVKKKTIATAVGVIVTGIAGAIWLAFKPS